MTLDPYRWQEAEDRLHGDVLKRAIYASPRLGKTRAMVRSLIRRRPPRTLITAPSRVCPIWQQELHDAGLDSVPLFTMTNAKIEREYDGKSWEGILVVNRDKLLTCADTLEHLDAFIADESHSFSGVSTGRAIAYRKLCATTPWVRALSGTPVVRHYGSLWSQLCKFGSGWEEFTSFEKFAQAFLVRDAMFRSRVLAHINVDRLQQLVLNVASIYRREDYFGADQWQVVRRNVDMGERAWKLYNELAKKWILSLPHSELIAANPGVRLMRLQEITSGFLPDAPAERLPLHQAKIDALLGDFDEIHNSDEKLVVWHRFTHEGEVCLAEFARLYPSLPLFAINGRVSAAQAQEVQQKFNATQGSAVVVAQIQSASEGISLRAADHAAYLSRTFSFIDDEQSRDRIFDLGKPRTVIYYECPGTVDDFIAYDVLGPKRELHESVRNADKESMVFGNIRRRKKSA